MSDPHATAAHASAGATSAAGVPRLRLAVLALEWPSVGASAGGEGRYARRLCERLATDVDMTVITGPDPVPLEGANIVPVGFPRPGGSVERYYRAPLRAARIVDRLAPDVIHAHQDEWPMALGSKRVPIVRTYHGRKIAEARTSRRLVRRINQRMLAGLEVFARRRASIAVGVGPDSVAAFACDHLIPPVFLCGEPGPPAVKASEPLVIFVGAFSSRKRGFMALQAVVHARRLVPNLRFAVVGADHDRDSYPPWVEFHANPDDEIVASLIGESWVLLAPSRYEGFGIPAWEAMIQRTAVVATANPGIDFLSLNGSHCTVVSPPDLGDALARLLTSPAARLDQAERAFVRAQQVARLGHPDRYLSLFRELARATSDR